MSLLSVAVSLEFCTEMDGTEGSLGRRWESISRDGHTTVKILDAVHVHL